VGDNAHVTGVPLLLARHGQTADNADGLILGRRDPPLSKLGERQAARLASGAREQGVVALWCSPLLRAPPISISSAPSSSRGEPLAGGAQIGNSPRCPGGAWACTRVALP
jgi:hypothetical protein